MPDYHALADLVAAEISSGRLKPGERLPPQRQFAYERSIAVSTASRVYTELVRRGLVTGEVGRGTYVRPPFGPPGPALAEPPSAAVDLELNFPVLPQQPAELIELLARLIRPGTICDALRPVGAAATAEARALTAGFLARDTWTPDPAGILFAGNGRQGIAAAMSALASAGDRIGIEAITYPVVKGIAARLGITLVPLALDESGLCPEAIVEAHKATPLRGIYLQPLLHNPLGITMSPSRRRAIADALNVTGLFAIEDAIYAFLVDEQPLVALAPDRVILVDSFSKRIAPGLTLGFVVAPPPMVDKVARALRSGGWSASGFPLMAGLYLMSDRSAHRIGIEKRDDASTRQRIARAVLAGLTVRGDARAYHLWLELPDAWRAEAFCAAALRQGIAIVPASAFAVAPGHAPNAVRIALASPPHDSLAAALRKLKQIAAHGPDNQID